MKEIILSLFLLLIALAAFYFKDFWWQDNFELVSPLSRHQVEPEKLKPLAKYSFESLKQRVFSGSQIKLEKVMQQEDGYTTYLFAFRTEGKKITGQANIPTTRSPKGEVWPVIIMLRGYADDEVYFTGLGTRKAAGFFAERGFITLAPDFLGFGGSDEGSSDILENRFERPITVLDLLSSVKTLKDADPDKVMIWGHSNGGQIAISVLEITQKPYPTTLWAPVTKGFPESVLAYMGEMDDKGLKVKAAIDQFLEDYEPKQYSVDQYFGQIQAPIQVHQGTADPLVSLEWTDGFVNQMESLNKQITYYKYRGNDHNLAQSWDLVVSRDLEFFRKNLK